MGITSSRYAAAPRRCERRSHSSPLGPGVPSNSTFHAQIQDTRVFEQTVTLENRAFRQLFIEDLGHDDATILLTNDRNLAANKLSLATPSAMLIENALSDAVRFFHMDALVVTVGLKVDFDMALLVLASTLYARSHAPCEATATPRRAAPHDSSTCPPRS